MTYEKWRARLADANDPAFVPIDYIDGLLSDGRAQFWATEHAALVTRVKQWPGGARTIETLAGAGRKRDLVGPLKEAVLAWGERQGCTHALVIGRDGWRREHPDFEHHQTILLKQL